MIDVRPIAGSFSCEVKGLNLWEDLDEDVIEELRAAWSRGGVLVFRRQALSEDELVRFCAHFGSPDIIVRTDWQSTNRPEIVQITNMKNQIGRSIGGLGAGELDWHTDQSYVTDPATGALLYMVEMPKAGGRTYWANLYLAYETLPEETK